MKAGPKNEKKAAPSRTDPAMLADRFLGRHVWSGGGGEEPKVQYTLRRWHGDYYRYNLGRYKRVADDTIRQEVTADLQGYADALAALEGVRIAVTRNLATNVLANIDAKIQVPETVEFNTWLDGKERGFFLCVHNGLLHLGDDLTKPLRVELIDHTPRYFTPTRLPYEYDPTASCHLWQEFLSEIMVGRQDYIDLLQEFVGYLFRHDLHEQKFLLCVGEGANGKGVFSEVVQNLVGTENCSQVPITCFADRFALYSTVGKTINVTHESSHVLENEAENVLKSFVAGDSMTLDRKFKEPLNVHPTAKLMISTNALPRFTDRTQAVWRRILLAPFDLVVKEEDQQKDLASRLKKELPGILNWALKGLERLNGQGFTVPEGNRELMEEYRRDADPARAFLTDNYCELAEGQVPSSEVYAAYRKYCEDNGCKAMNERHFGQHVRRIFPTVERQRVGPRGERQYVYRGLVSYQTYPIADSLGHETIQNTGSNQ